MGFPIPIDTISMGLSIVCLKGNRKSGVYYDACLTLNVVLILTNIEDPDEMQHYAAFHLGLHRLPKYTFIGSPYTMGIRCVWSTEMWFISFSVSI